MPRGISREDRLVSPKRAEIKAAIVEGGTDSYIGRRLNVSRQFVGEVREEMGLEPSIGSGMGRRPLSAQPDRHDGTVDVDGGTVTAEVASGGRALLTVHEHRTCTAVVRLTRAQLEAVIAELTAVWDQLPAVASEVVGHEDQEDGS